MRCIAIYCSFAALCSRGKHFPNSATKIAGKITLSNFEVPIQLLEIKEDENQRESNG